LLLAHDFPFNCGIRVKKHALSLLEGRRLGELVFGYLIANRKIPIDA
jgi:hypothetical protein